VKLLNNFAIIPQASILIERDLKFENNSLLDDKFPLTIIILLIKKIREFNQPECIEIGAGYFLGCIVPMIYKYSTATSNLVVFNSEKAL
jgi:hypothetical protein